MNKALIIVGCILIGWSLAIAIVVGAHIGSVRFDRVTPTWSDIQIFFDRTEAPGSVMIPVPTWWLFVPFVGLMMLFCGITGMGRSDRLPRPPN
jgi:hypothetical protein